MTQNIKTIAANMHTVYEQKAEQFDRDRTKTLMEHPWLKKFSGLLPNNASILDVGCGSGEPIAQYFIEKGYELSGVDYAHSMIALAKQRFPKQHWHHADMRTLNLGETYDGLISWHSFFHLTRDEQRAVLPIFAEHLNDGGTLILTVGSEDGECIGYVGGENVYHASLTPDEYREILRGLDFDIIDFVFGDPECGFANILLAQKKLAKK